MTLLTTSLTQPGLGDSMPGWALLRALLADACSVILRTLVLQPSYGLGHRADRTSFRTTLLPAPSSAAQPDMKWTIPRVWRTMLLRALGRRAWLVAGAIHLNPFQCPHRIGSPGGQAKLAPDETRAFDQRQSARNAGGYPRGRPAR